jgi:PhnB protein
MPKRSLKPGNGDSKKIEQLNRALEQMMARDDGRVGKPGAEVEPLVRIAAELRNLPNAKFKARLKSELGGTRPMSTVAEPIAATRTITAPRLAFRDAAKAIEFYQKALGAKETFRFEVGGQIPHAEMAVGDSTIHLTEEWPEGGRFSAETLGHSPISLDITVPDVDAFAERAVAAGMKVVRPLKDQFYGHRDVTMLDPFGYSWTAVTVKEEMSVEEMHRRMKGMMEGPEGGNMPGKVASFVRPGLRRLTPYLVAKNGLDLLDFAVAGLGAKELARIVMPTGVHGEVQIGDSIVMMGGGIPGKEFGAGTLQPAALHVYVEDADALIQKAVAAGATLIDEPVDQDYGERSGTVKDGAGNVWYIAKSFGDRVVPEGLHSVNPYLHPRRAEPVIAFLKRAFGAEEMLKYTSPDGVVNHAAVRIADSVIEMGEAHGKYEPMPAMFYLYVPNVEGAYRQALSAGATSIQEPADQPYGDRNAAVKDNFGYKWYLATHIKDVAH